ncbi:hypothetical protein ROZALSC1DRAFT_30082 [Rozella allomycis CSF55]|uniref:Uncharacterized protein n=1 Tax=Rozella allomycis (strain CSF55) TaxID=988480 RepID=A0A4P9YHN4_ROZAC|nr:hypothetical protein ROZALSC1DRAFT_30082 [Rozella allomycis CSF55]
MVHWSLINFLSSLVIFAQRNYALPYFRKYETEVFGIQKIDERSSMVYFGTGDHRLQYCTFHDNGLKSFNNVTLTKQYRPNTSEIHTIEVLNGGYSATLYGARTSFLIEGYFQPRVYQFEFNESIFAWMGLADFEPLILFKSGNLKSYDTSVASFDANEFFITGKSAIIIKREFSNITEIIVASAYVVNLMEQKKANTILNDEN